MYSRLMRKPVPSLRTPRTTMKLQMKREALTKLNRQANEGGSFGTAQPT